MNIGHEKCFTKNVGMSHAAYWYHQVSSACRRTATTQTLRLFPRDL